MKTINRVIILSLVGLILIVGCDKKETSCIGVCDKSLFETVKKDGTIRISISLKMSLMPEDESELIEEVAKIQEEFIQNLIDLNLNVTGIQKLLRRPRLAMGVDEEALAFICNSDKVEDVKEEVIDTTQ